MSASTIGSFVYDGEPRMLHVGGNITTENISVRHYMNTTWVSRPIPEDRPTEQQLLGEFYDSEVF